MATPDQQITRGVASPLSYGTPSDSDPDMVLAKLLQAQEHAWYMLQQSDGRRDAPQANSVADIAAESRCGTSNIAPIQY
jgi:hypothetical protein